MYCIGFIHVKESTHNYSPFCNKCDNDKCITQRRGITLHNRYFCNGTFKSIVFFSDMKCDFKSLKLAALISFGRLCFLHFSRHFSFLTQIGSVLLWVYWPSFNGLLASDDARHRAYINTYISLIASTLATFAVSAMFGG